MSYKYRGVPVRSEFHATVDHLTALSIERTGKTMTSITALLQQIHIGLSPHGYEPVAQYETQNTTYAEEHDKLEASLLDRCPAHLWPHDSYTTACPRPILISKHHQQQLQDLQEALTSAITDIVQRWWTDRDARFPARLPLEEREEELLQVNCPPIQVLTLFELTLTSYTVVRRPSLVWKSEKVHRVLGFMEA